MAYSKEKYQSGIQHSYSSWKIIINIDMLGDSNGQSLTIWLTALTSCTNRRSIDLDDLLFYNIRYALDGWIVIFCHFFLNNNKKAAARAKKDARFNFFYFARSSTPTADRHHFLVPLFQANSVIYLYCNKCAFGRVKILEKLDSLVHK